MTRMSDIGVIAEETNRMLIDRFCRDIANAAQRYGVHIDPERGRVECIDDELMQDNSYRIVIQVTLNKREEFDGRQI